MQDETRLPTVLRKKLPPFLEKIKYGQYTKNDNDYLLHLYLKENDIIVDETGSDVINFFRGKSILITGATGFLGKLLVEKLLRCCKDIETIYIIVRTKKGKDPQTRVQEYLDNWVFVKLSDIYPNFGQKIVGISGDLEENGLGLSEESKQILTQKVNIIYHVAATVRFDEKLKKAVQINLKGTREIIKLAKECRKLDLLTHVSTAYSNCHFNQVKEQFYPPLMDPQDLIAITDRLSSDVIDEITPELLGNCPNTYAFTKQIAEDLVRTESVGIPTCIYRPSIVIASAREPIRSWVDNIYSPVGLIAEGIFGVLHVMLGDPNARADLVPADYVVNSCIAASYKTAKDYRIANKVQIFNFTSSKNNPVYWKDLDYMDQAGRVGSTKLLMLGSLRFTKCWYKFIFLSYILHTLPGYIFDFFAVRLGKKPILTQEYIKINKFVKLFSHFTLSEWIFESNNTDNLWNSLNEKDKKIFVFDMSTINWHDYFDTYMVAIRELLVFEFLDNLEQGRRYQKRLFLVSYTVICAFLALCVYLCLNKVFFFIFVTFIMIIMIMWIL